MLRNAVFIAVFLALGSLSQAAPADPALAQKWVTYGQQLFAQKQYDKAIQAFSTAARADQRNAAAYKGLGNAYYYKKDYPNALKYYKYAYQLNPADTGLGAFIPKLQAAASQPAGGGGAAELGARYYQAKRYDEAINSYNQALAANPNDAKSWQMLGYCYVAKGDKPKAVEAIKKSLQLNPGNTALSNYLASYAPGETPGSAAAAADGPREWGQALWRSAVLPGWGQAYNGQVGKGWLLGGLTLGCFAGTVGTYIIGDSARAEYMSLTDPTANFDGPYSTWESMANLNHILYISFGVAYTFTLVDAIISAKPKARNNALFYEEVPPVQLGAIGSGIGSGLGVTYRLASF